MDKVKKTYKDFEKKYIGSSDIAALVLVGGKKDADVTPQMLKFGGDGSYRAYVVNDADAQIGDHYTLVASFENWLSVYDDDSLTLKLYGKKINVYRSGSFGCVIHVVQ